MKKWISAVLAFFEKLFGKNPKIEPEAPKIVHITGRDPLCPSHTMAWTKAHKVGSYAGQSLGPRKLRRSVAIANMDGMPQINKPKKGGSKFSHDWRERAIIPKGVRAACQIERDKQEEKRRQRNAARVTP